MPEPVSIGVGIGLATFWGYAKSKLASIGFEGGEAYAARVLSDVRSRFSSNDPQFTKPLDRAFKSSVGKAVRVLAIYLHDPQRKPLKDLVEDVSDWPEFVKRLAEIAQGNIVAGTPRDHWLALLVEQSKVASNFDDIDSGFVVDDNWIRQLLEDDTDQEAVKTIETAFLAWVQRHSPDNGHKPIEFEQVVREGWRAPGSSGKRFHFYHVVKLFFQEALERDPQCFRAFSISFFTVIQKELREIRKLLPDRDAIRRFEETIATFEEKEFDANYARFKTWMRRQNEKLFEFLRMEFSETHRHLDQQDKELERIRVSATSHNQKTRLAIGSLKGLAILILFGIVVVIVLAMLISSKQEKSEELVQSSQENIADRIAGLETLIQKQLQRTEIGKSSTSRINFPGALREWAIQLGITPKEAQAQLNAWVAEVRKQGTNLTERARAEFLAQRFAEAAQLSDQAAANKLVRSRQLNEEGRKLKEGAVLDLMRAGESLYAAGEYAASLIRFEQALGHSPREANPKLWSDLQNWLGNCHLEIGVRSEGDASIEHLDQSIVALENSLQVRSRERLPWHWAGCQNNMGNSLAAKARIADGSSSLRLLTDGISAYHLALSVYTRDAFPEDWAMTQNNLGGALFEKAKRSGGTEAIQLLSDAERAMRGALEIRTRERFPERWAATQNNLGLVLGDQAKRSEGQNAVQLLEDAVAAFRAALEVYTLDDLPEDYAMAQSNLGSALHAQANTSAGPETIRLLKEAVAAYKEALRIRTRDRLPQDWAATLVNLGSALNDQAGRIEGDEAEKLFNEAVRLYHEALKVYSREQFPQRWAGIQINLSSSFIDLAKRKDHETMVELLGKAITACHDALSVFSRDEFPMEWAVVKNNLGNALSDQAYRTEGPEAIPLIIQSVEAYQDALSVYSREQTPQDWARTLNNLGLALSEKARRIGGLESPSLFMKAVTIHRSLVEFYSHEDSPQMWAMAQNNLGTTLGTVAERLDDRSSIEALNESVSAFRSALEVWTPSEFPYWNRVVTINLNQVEEKLRSHGKK